MAAFMIASPILPGKSEAWRRFAQERLASRRSDENFGRVARMYIETLQDRGVTPALQKKMYTSFI